MGDMIRGVKIWFEKIYSIELDEELFRNAERVFGKEPNIRIYHGDSRMILPNVLKHIQQPCLFWLDAHYSGGVTAIADTVTPIESELKIIARNYSTLSGSIILIDDAGSFAGYDQYPNTREINDLLLKIDCEFTVEIRHGVICAFNKKFARHS